MLNGFWRNFVSELFTVLGLSAKKSHGTDLHLNEWDGVFLYGHYIVLQERKVVQNAFPWPANLRQLFHLNFSPFYFTKLIVYTFDLEKWQNVHVVVSIVAVFFFYSYEVSFVKYTINYHMNNTILSGIFLMLDTLNEQVLVDDLQFYFVTCFNSGHNSLRDVVF